MKIKPIIFAAIAASTSLILATENPARSEYSGARDVSYCSTTLQANDPNSKIWIRQGPGVNQKILHYGFSGDLVDILRETPGGDPTEWAARQDRSGYSWYKVGFRESRATGWVREDLLTLPPTECRD